MKPNVTKSYGPLLVSLSKFFNRFSQNEKKERKTNFALIRELRCVNMKENGEKKNTTIEEKKKDIIAKKKELNFNFVFLLFSNNVNRWYTIKPA